MKPFSILLGSILSFNSLAESPLQSAMQSTVDNYLTQHQKSEGLTGVQASILIPAASEISEGDIHTAVAGHIGFPPYAQPLTKNNLFQIGSITKSFIALIILQLKIEGKLALSDPLGKWFPQYENWKKVTIRQLLTMTSRIPNYSADKEFLAKLYKEPHYTWSNEELISYAHPERRLPLHKNQFEYSNTNYILAGLIIEKVSKDNLAHQIQQRILDSRPQITNPHGDAAKTLGSPVKTKGDKVLTNTFYPAGLHGQTLQTTLMPRMAHGYDWDPKTKKMIDVTDYNLSWAGAAGAVIANSEDVIKWVQILYHGALLPPRYRENGLAQLENIVSMKTGQSIPTVTAADPKGFGLGVGAYYDAKTQQKFWVYEGSTLGYRVLYLWKSCNDVTVAAALNSKGAEGNPDSAMTDDILALNLQLYQLIMKQYPDLKCREL